MLKAGRDHDAYAIADGVLVEDPVGKDFQDLVASPAFEAWRRSGR
jgi:hypothetical protein